jgi:hypothetical protein
MVETDNFSREVSERFYGFAKGVGGGAVLKLLFAFRARFLTQLIISMRRMDANFLLAEISSVRSSVHHRREENKRSIVNSL